MSNPSSSGNQEDGNNIFPEEAPTLAFITIQAALLQMKFQSEMKWPYQTDFAIMVAFLLVLYLYFFILVAKNRLVETYANYAEIIRCYVHLCGFLLNVLLLMMLLPILGRIFLGIWSCCFVILTYWLRAKINAPRANAGTGGNLNAGANGDGIRNNSAERILEIV